MKVQLSNLAEQDLESIFLYTAERWSWSKAEAYVFDICDTLNNLDQQKALIRPLSGKVGFYRIQVGSHFAIFTMINDCCKVARILHQQMDILAHL